MKKVEIKPKEVDGIVGYSYADLKEWLNEEELKDFDEFIRGQTVMVDGDDVLIYKHDFEPWLHRLKQKAI